MKAIEKVAISVLVALAVVLLVTAVYLYVNPPIGFGITHIQFGSSRAHESVIWVTVENNRNTSLGITAVYVNGTQIGDEPLVYPNLYPRLANAIIAPRSRLILLIEEFDWKRSDPQGTKYVYEITLITSEEGVIFTASKETPPAPT